jgi:tetratricopeptide (TPR) repeat protein
MKLSRIHLVALLAAIVVSTGGCSLVNRVRAKNAVNEGARAYKEGRFAEAETKFRYAYELDPTQKNAPLLIARSVHAQYKSGVQAQENVAIGEKAIAAYQEILNTDPTNEDAYKAIVSLYTQMKRDEKVNELLMQRANSGPSSEKRAEALIILASKQWQCSFDITDQKDNKTTENKPDKAIVHYKRPANPADFDKAQQCATKGLELAEQAISLDPNNPSAWSYKANLLREKAKLAEMDSNTQAKADYDKQYAEALETQKRLSEEATKKKEAEEAAKSPTPPPS